MVQLSRLASTVLVTFSGLAFGVLAMTGVVAAVVFPQMKQLDPTLPAFSGYSGEHWSLAAGYIAERVFNIGFVLVGISLSLCVAAVLTLLATRRIGGMPILRLGLVLITVGLFLTQITWLQPRMDRASEEYREAAVRGEAAVAAEAKSRFDDLHPIASNLIVSSTVAAMLLFGAAAWASTRPQTPIGRSPGDGAA